MKLIDLLVQELPVRGGWPEGIAYAAQDGSGHSKGKVYGYEREPENRGPYWINTDEKDDSGYGRFLIALRVIATDCTETFVTKEHYKQALAAKLTQQ